MKTRLPLKGKRILVTAGPTWVAIDRVRVISNISTGEMGKLISGRLAESGAQVDLVLGPVGYLDIDKRIQAHRFIYFDELKDCLKQLLEESSFDAIVHAAAVSDYVTKPAPKKISSENQELVLELKRAPKIIRLIRKLQPEAALVSFKLESGVSDAVLIQRAKKSLRETKSQLVVANSFDRGRYRAFILDSHGIVSRCPSKKELAEQLVSVLSQRLAHS